VIFENEDDSEEFIRRDIIRKRQATVIPGSGIDTKAFKHRYGISKSKNITFLLIARLIKDKGVVEYVEAVKAIRYKYPDARFKILGSFYFDNPSAISKDEVNSWVESGTIEYLGYTDNVLDEIEKVDCIVLPSYREGLSRVLLEAGSMSKPIITTNVTGCKEVVDDGYNGFLVKPKDSISLAIAMEKMINLSYRERVQMGIRGRLKVINEFDDKIVIKKYMDTILSSEDERLILSRA
jgi:glycosyltransferase involved in cell wall biosynthesis